MAPIQESMTTTQEIRDGQLLNKQSRKKNESLLLRKMGYVMQIAGERTHSSFQWVKYFWYTCSHSGESSENSSILGEYKRLITLFLHTHGYSNFWQLPLTWWIFVKYRITSNHRKIGVNEAWIWIFEWAIENRFNWCMMMSTLSLSRPKIWLSNLLHLTFKIYSLKL